MKTRELAKSVGLENLVIRTSVYGVVNGVNIRVSDHLPKYHDDAISIGNYEKTDGVYKFIFVILDKEVDFEEEQESIKEDIEIAFDYEEEVEVLVVGFSEEVSNEHNSSYLQMLINTI